MKSFLMSLSIFSSLSAFASGDSFLLLDASCKVECLTSVTRVTGSQGYSYKREFANVYIDYTALTREQLDKKLQSESLDKLCKATFSENAAKENSDCLYFKH